MGQEESDSVISIKQYIEFLRLSVRPPASVKVVQNGRMLSENDLAAIRDELHLVDPPATPAGPRLSPIEMAQAAHATSVTHYILSSK